jgi:hypothetical protein
MRFWMTWVLAFSLGLMVVSSPAAAADEQASAKAAIPSTSPLAKIKEGMSSEEVTKILGDPDSSDRHVTGKAFIPFYFGTDAVKTEWRFKHVGRVIFSKGSFSGSHVSGVEYDPTESGAAR